MPYPGDNEIVQFFTGPLATSTAEPLVSALIVAIDNYSGHLSGATNLGTALDLIDVLQAGGQGVFVGFSADGNTWRSDPQTGDTYIQVCHGHRPSG